LSFLNNPGASHARTFVEVERRGRALEAALEGLLEKVHSVESEVVKTQQALEQEEETSGEHSLAALSEKHRVRRRTLLQHSSLLELLELPSLMDACVRSNLYEEALSIAAFANTLERRHTEKNPVVMKVISQVRSRQSDLRRYLLHSLKNPVTMPECLEIVTALRRLNSIDLERQSVSESSNLDRVHAAMELSLQVDFLEARDVWLDQPMSSSNNTLLGASATSSGTSSSRSGSKLTQLHSSSSEHLLDTIERYRTRYDLPGCPRFFVLVRRHSILTTGAFSFRSCALDSITGCLKLRRSITLFSGPGLRHCREVLDNRLRPFHF
jgi:hypothetical protein